MRQVTPVNRGTANGAFHDPMHRLYQGVLYFTKVSPCHSTCVTVISFRPSADFRETHTCSTALRADLLTEFHHEIGQ